MFGDATEKLREIFENILEKFGRNLRKTCRYKILQRFGDSFNEISKNFGRNLQENMLFLEN